MVPDPSPIAYAFINVGNCERPLTSHVTLVVHRSQFIVHIQRSLNGTVRSFIVQLCKILTFFYEGVLLGFQDFFTC